MSEYVNPFNTFNESIAVLKNLGVDPMHEDNECNSWQEEIISIAWCSVTSKVLEIHLSNAGFDMVYALMQSTTDSAPEILKSQHTDEYDVHYIEPSRTLKLFKLVPKENDK